MLCPAHHAATPFFFSHARKRRRRSLGSRRGGLRHGYGCLRWATVGSAHSPSARQASNTGFSLVAMAHALAATLGSDVVDARFGACVVVFFVSCSGCVGRGGVGWREEFTGARSGGGER